MQILLTNDDGIYAPGLAALENELKALGDVCVVAPATEQSGVGHSITFLSPIIAKDIYTKDDRHRGWAVEGSPADCVKIGVFEFCQPRPDLIVSGINSGLNAGINVLYSGTVAAAIEGAFFGITSIAVSLEYDDHADYGRAAELAVGVIRQMLTQSNAPNRLYNLNIPTAAIEAKTPKGLKIVPMGVERYGEHYIKRQDPKGRNYYWATGDPPPRIGSHETDLSVLAEGYISLSPLHFDLTEISMLDEMKSWNLVIPG